MLGRSVISGLVGLSLIWSTNAVAASATTNSAQTEFPLLAAMSSKGGNCGFINLTGQFAIPAIYEDAIPFDDSGLAWVRRGKKSEFIDKKGRVVFSLPDDTKSPGFGKDDLAVFSDVDLDKSRSGFVNRKGEIVIAKKWKLATSFNGGKMAAVVNDSGKWGFINRAGEVVISPRYVSAEGFSKGSYILYIAGERYKMDEDWNVSLSGYVDYDNPGKVKEAGAYPMGYTNAQGFFLASFDDEKPPYEYRTGLLKPDGTWQIKPLYEHMELDDDPELIPAQKKDGKRGYLDYAGNWAIQPSFTYASGFNGKGYARAWLAEKGGLIDRKGNWLFTPKFALLNQCRALNVAAPMIASPPIQNKVSY